MAESLLQAGTHRGRERTGCARGAVRRQEGIQPPGGIPCQPAADGMAADAQQTRHLLAVLGWGRDQQGEPL
jgi:hypothetical protein